MTVMSLFLLGSVDLIGDRVVVWLSSAIDMAVCCGPTLAQALAPVVEILTKALKQALTSLP